MAPLLSRSEAAYLADGIAADVRADGRRRGDYRPLTLTQGVVAQASGSARLRLGETDVIVAVKLDIGSPSRALPRAGRLQVTVEVAATAAPEFRGRAGEAAGAEFASVLSNSLAGAASGAGAALDMSSLCIKEGVSCWLVYLDCVVLNAAGGVLDALAIAAKAALADTRVPRVTVVGGGGGAGEAADGEAGPAPGEPGGAPEAEDGAEGGAGGVELEVDDDPSACWRLDVSEVPLLVTVRAPPRRTALEEPPAPPPPAAGAGGTGSGSGVGVGVGGPPAVPALPPADGSSIGEQEAAWCYVDATAAEEALGGPALAVAVGPGGRRGAVAKLGGPSVAPAALARLLAAADAVGRGLHRALDSQLAELAEASRAAAGG